MGVFRVLEGEVGGEECIFDDTVRHWGDHQLLVVALMGVRGKVEEVWFVECFFFVFLFLEDVWGWKGRADRTNTGETCITEPLEWGGGWIRVLVRRLAIIRRLRANRLNAIKSPIVF